MIKGLPASITDVVIKVKVLHSPGATVRSASVYIWGKADGRFQASESRVCQVTTATETGGGGRST